ncbi:MAG: GntR family transcriptional regulator [Victivallaceae bacterium]|nr:GntR family transcriptional regulator [Victivallaceae bacterium]MDD4180691.1 GntR family transcriptional regulator [Victivallaceae bacterium]
MARGKPEKYIGLAAKIRRMIQDEKMKPNTLLPSERKLSAHFEVNHLTLRKALRVLEHENLLYKVPSVGNYAGSRPNLGKGRQLIGFMFPDHEIFFYNILAELEGKLSSAELHPVIQLTNSIKRKEEDFIEFCRAEEVAALIAVPNSECRQAYENLPFPVLFFDIFISDLQIPYVISDDSEGSAKATRHLIDQGHRRIAHVGSLHERTSELRVKGYLDALRAAGIESRPEFIKRKEPTRQWGFYAVRELFALPEPPTAITCGNDTIAAGVLRALPQRGIKVPQQCAVTGFGNTSIAEDLDLTSVSQHTPKIATALWNLMNMRFQGKDIPLETTIHTTLQVRGSSSGELKHR